MNNYNPKDIEPKWQQFWDKSNLYQASEQTERPKKYILVEFPYPSGQNLHMGHLRPYVAGDVTARYWRAKGYEVLYPMGWDAFGLPAENYAIKMGIAPSVTTAENIANAKEQLLSWGMSFDWSREVNTTDPGYYTWTQWIFLQFFKAGLAYEAVAPINWCPKDKTGLANEEVIDGKCERCHTPVEKKNMRQWFLKITDYAEKLLDGLKDLNWPESVKIQQANWIGKSEGAEIDFPIRNQESGIRVFTTRPDTLFGVTYLVIAPEHHLIKELKSYIENADEVAEYIKQAEAKSEIDRGGNKEKSGVELKGIKAIHPLTNEELPIWIADYVLMGYGTGAVMAVPAHDERDWEFAQKFNLPIRRVVAKEDAPIKSYLMGADKISDKELEVLRIEIKDKTNNGDRKIIIPQNSLKQYEQLITEKMTPGFWNEYIGDEAVFIFKYLGGRVERLVLNNETEEEIDRLAAELMDEKWTKSSPWKWLAQNSWYTDVVIHSEHGSIVNSDDWNGWNSKDDMLKVIDWIENQKIGNKKTTYKLRDWLFSRQRYWGEPIPVIHCSHCAVVKYPDALEINVYDQATWQGLINGMKTIETRALNPEEPHRYFGDVKVGDYIKLNNKETGEKRIFNVLEAYRFKSIDDLYNNKSLIDQVRSDSSNSSLEEFIAGYASYAPDYLERIKKNGLVGWKVRLIDEIVPVPDEDLPVKLPEVERYEPTGTGESPLAAIEDWVNVACPACGGKAKRETNTMPQWAGSSWYYLRYLDSKNDQKFANQDKLKHWLPIDTYFGGMEHTTLHLLYSRFWNLFLYDQGLVPVKEPYARREPHGIILGPDGEKMSKSRGNVVNPDDVIAQYGADALRMYELFLGPHTQTVTWDTRGIVGVHRFLQRLWDFVERNKSNTKSSKNSASKINKLIQKISSDIESVSFNTSISSFMEFLNQIAKEQVSKQDIEKILILVSTFAPHIAEELWRKIGHADSIMTQPWPNIDKHVIANERVTIIVQINGKTRGVIDMAADSSEQSVIEAVKSNDKLINYLENNPKKVIFVTNKIINFVV